MCVFDQFGSRTPAIDRDNRLAEANAQNERRRQGRLSVVLWFACAVAAFLAQVPASAVAADIMRSNAIGCRVADGRGAASYGRSKHLGEIAGTQRFSQWVFAQDGVNLHDTIGLFWNPSVSRNMSLRVAIDGPVSKPTQLISVGQDTLVAVATTSDQQTTRTWLITINFRHELVMAVAASSGAVAVKAQVMMLSCTFDDQQDAEVPKSAADSWRR